MLKKLLTQTAICATLVVTSCFRTVDPNVATRYFHPGERDEQRDMALSALYEFYITSDKSKEYYEIISRIGGHFIVNYYPAGELLTYCTDPGSGWSGQAQNVSPAQLQRLVNLKISLDQLGQFIYRDSVLVSTSKTIRPKTNGSPSI